MVGTSILAISWKVIRFIWVLLQENIRENSYLIKNLVGILHLDNTCIINVYSYILIQILNYSKDAFGLEILLVFNKYEIGLYS